ncbi:hypothetical protein GCM10009863_56500 [Streptomyces axinellae]|uniref:Ketoreductase n=1 Tax=Streptomyces axinellae TaxID=552788 RepID=A0ABN3QR27_9ACTN
MVAIGRRSGPLEEAAAGHGRITPLAADITADGEPERIVRAVRETHDRLDVLVSNAAIVRAGALGDLTQEAASAQLATNLVAPLLLTQAALPLLAASGGVIVNVSTSVGQRAWPGNSVYAATKAALELLTRSWAVEPAPRGVRVVAVAPGAIDTPIGEHQGLTAGTKCRRAGVAAGGHAAGADRPPGGGGLGGRPTCRSCRVVRHRGGAPGRWGEQSWR